MHRGDTKHLPRGIGEDSHAGLQLSAAEVKQLRSFQDGSIMCVDVRHHLWRSWGLCPRHSWAQAVVEAETRWWLHGTVILYEDLVGRAAVAVRRTAVTHSGLARRLRSRDSCFTCDFVALPHDHSDPGLEALTARVNQLRRFAPMISGGRQLWWRRSCPACLGGDGPLCRQHILAGLDPPGNLADQMERIGAGLSELGESMRWKGPPASDEAAVAWVEALGWFAGWAYPAAASGGQA